MTRDAFHRFGPRPRGRGERPCANRSARCVALRHPFACCDRSSPPSDGREPAPHATSLWFERLSTPASRRGRCSYRFLQPTFHTCTCNDRSTSGGRCLRFAHADRAALDGAITSFDRCAHAASLKKAAFAVSSERGSNPILAGSRSGEPLGSAPRAAALSSADEECTPTSDAPCRSVIRRPVFIPNDGSHHPVSFAEAELTHQPKLAFAKLDWRGPPPSKPRQRL
jgi:hypothetical protein